MSDKILIRGLRVPCVIGVWEWERQVRQELIMDIDLYLDTRAAGATDDFLQTLSYAEVAEKILADSAAARYQLIEALGAHLMESIFKQYPLVERLRLEIKKPGAVPEADYVGIELERDR